MVADVSISWVEYGYGASAYLLAYLAAQLPAGMTVDRFGARPVLLFSLCMSAFGLMLVILARHFAVLLLARIVTAVGDAFVYSALIKVASSEFRENRFALMMSTVQLAGYLGVSASTLPLAIGAGALGWRFSLLVPFFVLITLLGLMTYGWLTRPTPQPASKVRSQRLTARNRLALIAHLAPTLAAFSAYYFMYIFIFSAWGSRYLVLGGLTTQTSVSSIVLTATVGLCVGGVLSGIALTRVSRPAIAACAASIGVLIAIGLMLSNGNPTSTGAAMLLLGGSFGALSNAITATLRSCCGVKDISFASALHATLGNTVTAGLMPAFGVAAIGFEEHARMMLGLSLTVPTLIILGAMCWPLLRWPRSAERILQ
ncbi:major facilitator superfamily permease [Pandoraea sp. SD6-2]|nr:major facilitator superfamily permease [Pandoraea sp. SD6-2]